MAGPLPQWIRDLFPAPKAQGHPSCIRIAGSGATQPRARWQENKLSASSPWGVASQSWLGLSPRPPPPLPSDDHLLTLHHFLKSTYYSAMLRPGKSALVQTGNQAADFLKFHHFFFPCTGEG